MNNKKIINGVELAVRGNMGENIQILFPEKVDGVNFSKWLLDRPLKQVLQANDEKPKHILWCISILKIFPPEKNLFETRHIQLSDFLYCPQFEMGAKDTVWGELCKNFPKLRYQKPIERLITLGAKAKEQTGELLIKNLIKGTSFKAVIEKPSGYQEWNRRMLDEVNRIINKLQNWKQWESGEEGEWGELFISSVRKILEEQPEDFIHYLVWKAVLFIWAVLDCGFKLIFKRIYKQLTPVNRRVYTLIYFTRFPRLGKPLSRPFMGIPLYSSSLFTNFVEKMGEKIKDLVIKVLLRKEKRYASELEKLWRAYLKVDKALVYLIRCNWREKKQKQRRNEYLSKKNLKYVPYESLSDKQKVFTKKQETYSRAPITQKQLGRIIENRCTNKEKRRIMLNVQGYSEDEIAGNEGVSQQAVSKSVKNGQRKIREAVRRL